MTSSEPTESADGVTTTKVGRLIGEYELGDNRGARLEALWTGEADGRMSLRALAEEFNKELLEKAMTDANMSTVDGEVDNLYRLLTSGDVSSGKYTEARNLLEERGVDVGQLEKDFVTYQAIRSYLQNERGAEYKERDDDERLESSTESVQRLKSKVDSVVENTIAQLREAGIISIGDFRVLVNINVHCEDCGKQFQVIELLRSGSCDCEE